MAQLQSIGEADCLAYQHGRTMCATNNLKLSSERYRASGLVHRPKGVRGDFRNGRSVHFENVPSLTSSRRSEFGDSGRSPVATADRDKIPDERLHPKVANWRWRPKGVHGTTSPLWKRRSCPSAWCKSTAPEELRCAVLSGPQRTAEWEQYR